MHHDDLFDDRSSTAPSVGLYNAGVDSFSFADELEVPEDPLLRDEPLLTYKAWATAALLPVFIGATILVLFVHPTGLLASLLYNVALPGYLLYQAFAICKHTARWWWQCRSWPILDRRITSNYTGAGWASLALLTVWGAIFVVGLIRFVPVIGDLAASIGTFPGFGLAMLSLFYPPIARQVVRGLFSAKNALTGNVATDPYEIELALFDSQFVAEDGQAMSRVVPG